MVIGQPAILGLVKVLLRSLWRLSIPTIREHILLQALSIVEREYRTVEEVKSMLITAIERDREELLARGRTEGIEQGREQGKEQRYHQIAQVMAARGMALTVIADILSLTEKDVSRLLADDSAQ